MGETTHSLQHDIAETAEAFSRQFADAEELDYSVESLYSVDAIIEEWRDYEWDEDERKSAAAMAGCYVFEVARRACGGNYYWLPEQEQPVLVTGEPDYAISIFAFDKVMARLCNGQADNLPYYFEGFASAVEKGKASGYSATIF